MNAFETFRLYRALKLHFTTTYDYIKFHGKVKCTPESFYRRNDKGFFNTLSKQYRDDELKEIIISAHIFKADIWVGEILSVDVQDYHSQRMGTLQSLSYVFQEDMRNLLDTVNSPKELLSIGSHYPKLLTEYLDGSIRLETICILNGLIGFVQYWKDNIKDNIIWPQYYQKITKYSPLLDYDVVKYKDTLKNIMSCG